MHLVLFFFAALLFLNRPKLADHPPITVDIQYPKTTEHARVRGLGRVARPKPDVSLNDIGLKADFRARDPAADESMPGLPGGWDLDNPDPSVARFNQYVYEVVQRQLDFESRWLQERPRGTVKMRIWFDEKGNYLMTQSKFDAIDARFQKIVERALKNAFETPVPRTFVYSKKSFYIDREVYVRGTI